MYCIPAQAQTRQDVPTEQRQGGSGKEPKVIASLLADEVFIVEPTLETCGAASVSVVYLLLDNGDVHIICPDINFWHKEIYFRPPFTKEEAKIIMLSQMGKKPVSLL